MWRLMVAHLSTLLGKKLTDSTWGEELEEGESPPPGLLRIWQSWQRRQEKDRKTGVAHWTAELCRGAWESVKEGAGMSGLV